MGLTLSLVAKLELRALSPTSMTIVRMVISHHRFKPLVICL